MANIAMQQMVDVPITMLKMNEDDVRCFIHDTQRRTLLLNEEAVRGVEVVAQPALPEIFSDVTILSLHDRSAPNSCQAICSGTAPILWLGQNNTIHCVNLSKPEVLWRHELFRNFSGMFPGPDRHSMFIFSDIEITLLLEAGTVKWDRYANGKIDDVTATGNGQFQIEYDDGTLELRDLSSGEVVLR